MSMSIRTLIASLLLAVSIPAAADFVVVSRAYEVSLTSLRLPGAVNGTVTFRECPDCDYRTLRVTAWTVYEANDQPVTLEDLRKRIENVRRPSEAMVTVLHHLESDTVKAIRVWY